MIPSTTPSGSAQWRSTLISVTRPINHEDSDDDGEDEDRIPGLVDVEQQSPPFRGVVVCPDDERTTTVERVADHEQDRDEQERQHDRRPDGHDDLGAVA